MASKVAHRHIWKPGFGGGVVNTTLCGRVDNSTSDYNVADTDDGVTCKFCLRILNGHPNYNSKWLNWKPPVNA